jgi:GAF domain-containing protein
MRRGEVQPFTDKQIELAKIFADQAVIAIENVRLFTELEAKNRDLTESLEQQTATAEILRVISRSPTDVQPVFDTIARNAARLCEANYSGVHPFDGELLTMAAAHGFTPGDFVAAQANFPRRAGRESAVGRAVLTRAAVHIHDVTRDPEYRFPAQAQIGYRTILGVPMLREGVPIGAVAIWRREVRPFSEAQIALVTTFAAQAVIAVENVRLFKELEARNRDLTEAVLRQNPVRRPSRPRPAEPRRSGGLDPSPAWPFPLLQLGVRGGGQCPQLVKGHHRAGSSPGRGSMDPCHGNRACATRSSWASGGGKWAGRPYRN